MLIFKMYPHFDLTSDTIWKKISTITRSTKNLNNWCSVWRKFNQNWHIIIFKNIYVLVLKNNVRRPIRCNVCVNKYFMYLQTLYIQNIMNYFSHLRTVYQHFSGIIVCASWLCMCVYEIVNVYSGHFKTLYMYSKVPLYQNHWCPTKWYS